jgi:AraC-like DNA-binding protein/anti-sigma regulatory factor (Ser/Thr protein kinase)
VILGYCQAALAESNPYNVQLPDELVQDLRYIERSGVDLQRLINDILDLAQAETGTLQLYPEPIDTRIFLEEVFAAALPILAGAGDVRWRLQVPTALPKIMADSVRLRNTLMNLLDNAARFTQHGTIVLGAEATGAQLHVWVQDTGPGMPSEVVAQIRRDMYLPAAGPGVRNPDSPLPGLGLTISQHLVVQHGGEFQIESVPGRGTTCHIYLPLGSPEAEADTGERSRRGADGLRPSWPGLSAEQLVKKTYKYVADRYATPLTREEMAGDLGVSPSYLTRVFRRLTGLPLWDYVNNYRVARACELLEHSDMTVTEIAFAVGFNDPAYFSRVFRKETGKAPTRYRSVT